MIRVTGSEEITLEIAGMNFILNNLRDAGAIIDLTISREDAIDLQRQLKAILKVPLPIKTAYVKPIIMPALPLKTPSVKMEIPKPYQDLEDDEFGSIY